MRARSAALATIAMLLLGSTVLAHPLAPALLELRQLASGEWRVTWKVPLLLPPGEDTRPLLPPQCGPAGDARIEREAEALRASWSVRCTDGGLDAGRIGVEGLLGGNATVLLRVVGADGAERRWLLTGARSQVDLSSDGTVSSVRASLILGGQSVFRGIDHLAVLLGLFLFAHHSPKWRLAVAFFLLGQGAVLALTSLRNSPLPASMVEVGVAAGLLWVAAQLAHARQTRHPRSAWPLGLGLGLLCGATAAERNGGLGIPLASLSFALGLEVAQALVLCGLSIAASALRALPPAWMVAVRPLPAYGLGSLAVFWMLERVAALL